MMAAKPIPPLSESDKARFWSKVDKRGPDECWLWTAHQNEYGYGRISLGRLGHFIASRVAYFLSTETDPKDLSVLHLCDTPPCCNPSHLFIGTNNDNVADREAKGRNKVSYINNKGALNRGAKLTEAEVLEIRSRSGMTNIEIATEFGVHHVTVNRILIRKLWKHI